MRRKNTSPEEAITQLQKIFKKRGSKALEMAKKEILQEKFESKQVREALSYFMTQYWHDLARPTLLSVTSEAIGGDSEQTLPVAVPMILISGAIDIHDDIIDDSKTKNDRATVFGKFGLDTTLIVGDILLLKGLSLLGQAVQKGVPQTKILKIIDVVQKLFLELADAEALELQFRGRFDISPDAYLQMLWRKAGDVEAHTKVSAIVGGGSEGEIKALSRYGRLLGMLILLRDDWLDMLDFKELTHRMKKESLPLPILYAAQNPRTKRKINSILQRKNPTRRDAEMILTLVEATGFQKLKKLMRKLSDSAYSNLEEIKNRRYLEMVLSALEMPPFAERRGSRTTTNEHES